MAGENGEAAALVLNNWDPGERSDLVRRQGDKYVLRTDGRHVLSKGEMESKLLALERKYPNVSKARFLLLAQQTYANVSRRDIDRFKGASQKYQRSQTVSRNYRGAVRSVFAQFKRPGLC